MADGGEELCLFVVKIINPHDGKSLLAGQADMDRSGRPGVIKYQLRAEKFSEELEDDSHQVSLCSFIVRVKHIIVR